MNLEFKNVPSCPTALPEPPLILALKSHRSISKYPLIDAKDSGTVLNLTSSHIDALNSIM